MGKSGGEATSNRSEKQGIPIIGNRSVCRVERNARCIEEGETMKRPRIRVWVALVMAALLFAVSACTSGEGVPQEEYDEAVAELEQAEADLAGRPDSSTGCSG